MKSQAGVTLIETMICVALMAIVLSLSVSGFSYLRETQNQQITRESLASTLSSARQAAVSQRKVVYMCPSNDGGNSCSQDNNDWAKGWITYVDVNGNAAFNTGDTVLLNFKNKSNGGSTVNTTAGKTQIAFKPNGIVTATTFKVCSATIQQENHTIAIGTLGSISREALDASC